MYYTEKVPYGYNFADRNNEIYDTTGSMHGMHVSGIVAATATAADVNNNNGVKGISPEAQLLSMKVFSNSGYSGAVEDDIVAAIETSIELGADAINMSLGIICAFRDLTDPLQLAVKNAADNGVAFDKLPEGLELISYDPSKGVVNGSDVLTWIIGNLAPGESATLVLTTKTLVTGVITHNVNVTSDTYDPNLSNNADSFNITVKDSVVSVPPIPEDDNKTNNVVASKSSLPATGNPIAIVVLALLCLLGARLRRKA